MCSLELVWLAHCTKKGGSDPRLGRPFLTHELSYVRWDQTGRRALGSCKLPHPIQDVSGFDPIPRVVQATCFGGGRMADYRIYCLDRTGSISLAEWIEAGSDEEAVLQAREFKPEAHRCEVWFKNRLVAKINPEGRLEAVNGPRLNRSSR
jgi:hypothetical protein